MERVAEQDEGGIRRCGLGRREAGHPPAVRVAADGDIGIGQDHQVERRYGILGLAFGQVDGNGVDAARAKTVHERRHARRRAARAVPQVTTKAHLRQA